MFACARRTNFKFDFDATETVSAKLLEWLIKFEIQVVHVMGWELHIVKYTTYIVYVYYYVYMNLSMNSVNNE